MLTQVIYGPRLGRQGEIRVGCCAVIFDARREKVLLTRRADNGRWCLPGGRMEAGESAAEACAREVLEETGLEVQVKRLTGVYSDPNQLVIYPDGVKVFMVVLSFEAAVIGGELRESEETVGIGYFSIQEMESMSMHANHGQRVKDALKSSTPVVK